MKKLIAVLLILIICFSASATGDKEQNSVPSEVGTTTTESGSGLPIVKKPTTFTIFQNFDNIVFNPEWEVFQEVAKNTGISLKSVISLSNSNEKEAFNLMVASGKLADIIGYVNPNDLENLGRNGGLIPLNDLIAKYAPHIKATLEKDPTFKAAAYSEDGNIYYIPKGNKLKYSEFYWIRQDWLDKLGLEMPTTTAELHDVLYAFRNNDPNGNGKKDEVPLFDRRGDRSSDEYLQMFNTSTEFSLKNGKVVYDPMENEFATGVKELAKWYSEGIIDAEIFTRGAKSRDILLAGNLGGFTHDWVSTSNYKAKVQKDIPDFNMVAMAPPISPYGTQILRDERSATTGWAISSQCKDPVSVIQFFDYFFTDEGSTLINWGIEGKTYGIDKDGKKYFLDNIMHSDTTPLLELRKYGVQYRIGMIQDAEYEIACMADDAKVAAELYMAHPEWYPEETLRYQNQRLQIKIKASDDARYKNIIANTRPYVDEMYQSWVLGTRDFDKDWPEFKKELERRGINEAIAIVQRAYDLTKNK